MECKDGVCKLVPNKTLSVQVFQLSEDTATIEWHPRDTGPYKIEFLEPGQEWRTLLEASTSSFVRKKGLEAGKCYTFKVSNEKATVELAVVPEKSPPAPTMHATAKDDGSIGVLIQWAPVTGAVEYSVQLRQMSGDLLWTTLSDSIKGTALKKNNILPGSDYVARWRANTNNGWGTWSIPSIPVAVGNVDRFFYNLLGDSLLRGHDKVPVNSLAGKTVAIYFSGYFCPPCRQQTSAMKAFYAQAQAQGSPFEIVLISADRDKSDFDTYFGQMSWLALPYDSPRRQQIMSQYQVSGVPKLMIFGPKGNIISDNAAGVPLSQQLLDSWIR